MFDIKQKLHMVNNNDLKINSKDLFKEKKKQKFKDIKFEKKLLF